MRGLKTNKPAPHLPAHPRPPPLQDRPQWDAAKVALTADKARAEASGDTAGVEKADGALERLGNTEWMIEWMDKTRDLARRVTEWSITTKYLPRVSGVARERRVQRSASPGPDADHPYKYLPHSTDDSFAGADAESRGIYVCTGGGPGFMEAANRGASEAPGGRSIGMGITLPFEEGLNPYVSKELGFEYHYFFTRKFWMAYHMQALVVAPGGFGTLDELFEIMTLKQTGKMNRDLPIVLLGESYWRDVLNWERFAKYGTISSRDVDELFFTDSVDDAFAFVTEKLDSMAR